MNTRRKRLTCLWPLLTLAFGLQSSCGSSDSSSGAAGTWEIDREAVAEVFERNLEDQGNPMADAMNRMMRAIIESMDWTVTLHENGAAALVLAEDGDVLETSGSWMLAGSGLQLSYYDERDRTVTLNGILEGGRILLDAADPEQPRIVLKRSSRAALAAEEALPVPPMGPLRTDCPPPLTSAPRREGTPVDDIVSLRPGMAYDDVVALLECRDDIRIVQTSPLWNITDNFGIPTRQIVRASDGIPCNAREARGGSCDTGGGRFDPLRDITQEYVVVFTGMPDDEISRSVWRRTRYTEQDAQAISVLIEALQQKYGTPQLQATGSHLRINDVQPGATNLIWVYNQDGSPVAPPASQFSNAAMSWETCANGPNPRFAARHSWNSGCHTTIRAEILPQESNGLLAGELNLVVLNQRDLYYGSQQFETTLRTVSDEQLRQQSARPEL